MKGVPSTTTDVFECDCCLWQVSGYSKKELLDEGWEWHVLPRGRYFLVCGECEYRFAERRALKAGA